MLLPLSFALVAAASPARAVDCDRAYVGCPEEQILALACCGGSVGAVVLMCRAGKLFGMVLVLLRSRTADAVTSISQVPLEPYLIIVVKFDCLKSRAEQARAKDLRTWMSSERRKVLVTALSVSVIVSTGAGCSSRLQLQMQAVILGHWTTIGVDHACDLLSPRAVQDRMCAGDVTSFALRLVAVIA